FERRARVREEPTVLLGAVGIDHRTFVQLGVPAIPGAGRHVEVDLVAVGAIAGRRRSERQRVVGRQIPGNERVTGGGPLGGRLPAVFAERVVRDGARGGGVPVRTPDVAIEQ